MSKSEELGELVLGATNVIVEYGGLDMLGRTIFAIGCMEICGRPDFDYWPYLDEFEDDRDYMTNVMLALGADIFTIIAALQHAIDKAKEALND